MSKKAFTLIEVVIALVIMGIFTTMAAVYFSTDYNNQKICAENLSAIYGAIIKYQANPANKGEYPPDDVPLTATFPNLSTNTFHCPADTTSSTSDSYSQFYVKRNNYSDMTSFMLGCPRHKKNVAINLFFQGQIFKQNIAKPKAFGMTLGSPTSQSVIFADDSTVSGGTFTIIQSFFIGNGKCYTLLRVDAGNVLNCSVTPGSKFEVITPAAIAGVGGTRFTVDTTDGTKVTVTEGEVTVTDRPGKEKRIVNKDNSPYTIAKKNNLSEVNDCSQ